MFYCSVPLKKWKCSFEETLGLHSISDWLQEVAAVFAGSQFFNEIHAYVTAQRESSVVVNSDKLQDETDTNCCMTCDDNRDTNVSGVSDVSNSEYPTMQRCSQPTSDLPLTAITLPQYVKDNATDSCVTVTESDTAAVNKDTTVVSRIRTGIWKQQKSASPSKQTHHKSPSEVRQVNSRRESRKTKAVVQDNKVDETLPTGSSISAGNAHCVHL